MDCDWVFLKIDRSKDEVTLNESGVPTPGDGKIHDGHDYVVRYVVSGRIANPNPLAIATEIEANHPAAAKRGPYKKPDGA